MVWTIFVATLILWAAGVVSAHTFGGSIHVLMGIGLAIVVIRFVQDRRKAAHARRARRAAGSLDREDARA
ncbi:MAG TPA: lmo0937 family membrane protein [Methylomirabilota bacterium]|jgi:hypothetical protein|nr:lmo0937 family membrane protein [Methylomirabilota bacterium]